MRRTTISTIKFLASTRLLTLCICTFSPRVNPTRQKPSDDSQSGQINNAENKQPRALLERQK
jgi:hypothetical protein